MLSILVKFFFGGTIVTLVTLIAKTGNNTLAGIVMMFPAIILTSLFFLSLENPESVKETAFVGLIGLTTTAALLLTIALTIEKLPSFLSLLLGVASWFLVAVVVFLFTGK